MELGVLLEYCEMRIMDWVNQSRHHYYCEMSRPDQIGKE
jgi:hypothetical protein